jgi:3',5'-cyclic AMP phosphodiesterase CpdA
MNRPARCSKAVPRLAPAVVLMLWAAAPASAQELRLPLKDGSVRFAVIGDTGTASTAQNDVGKQMVAFRTKFPFDFVVMVGDNMYGSTSSANDFLTKFEQPYAQLLAAKVKFYAALGNHDNPTTSNYKDWNMGGQRFYTWRASGGGLAKIGSPGVRFFALDSNYLSKEQLDWMEKELGSSKSDWKICFFHHPMYSSARRHGSALETRTVLEPIFVKHGVSVVLQGHDHTYERTKPQQGIYYFVVGSSGSLRKGDLGRTPFLEKGYDQDYVFMLVEIVGDELYFAALTRTGQVVDSGMLPRPQPAAAAAPATTP